MNILDRWNSMPPSSIFLTEVPLLCFHGILAGVINFFTIVGKWKRQVLQMKIVLVSRLSCFNVYINPNKILYFYGHFRNRNVHKTGANDAALIKGVFLENNSYLKLSLCFTPQQIISFVKQKGKRGNRHYISLDGTVSCR